MFLHVRKANENPTLRFLREHDVVGCDAMDDISAKDVPRCVDGTKGLIDASPE